MNPHRPLYRRASLRIVATALALPVFATSLPSCGGPSRLKAVPKADIDRAVVMNNPAFRTWGIQLNADFSREILRAANQEFELRKAAGDTSPLPPADYLAISGGGPNGAYGAGLINGWSAAGTLPTFKVVTGISTGALTAPFAFLGPKYDEKLKYVYTHVSTKDIMTPRPLLTALSGDAMMDTAPLCRLLKKMVDESMMHEIAAEYAKGRLLLIGTTNLDAMRGVIWNVGAIASSGDPHALDLIHKIMIASAAIPVAFPPVMIDVMVDGRQYQEMHVDGGTRAQVFLYPPSFNIRAQNINRDRRAYIIRNARLDPEWADVNRRTLKIAARAVDSLIQTQGMGDLFRIFVTCQRDQVDYNLAYIPETFNAVPKEGFDPVYMKQLFDVGYNDAKNGYRWQKTPPSYVLADAPGTTAQPTGQTQPLNEK